MKTKILLAALCLITLSCNTTKNKNDASGTFEAEETIISSEASGLIKQFNLQEGQQLKSGQLIGYIDSTQLFLKKKQLEAQIISLLSKKPNISVQLATLQEQLKSAERDQKRIANLVKQDAATIKQLDDITTQVDVIKKQIDAQNSSLSISSEGISKDVLPLQIQVEQLNDQLGKCKIINPINGTVLSKYSEANEITVPGKPLYKIADLTTIILRAYITGNQLTLVKINQKVKVLTDSSDGKYTEHEGTITWINDKSEFTPKTIQTKDERANAVYAVKIIVPNDGSLKIGMFAEIKF